MHSKCRVEGDKEDQDLDGGLCEERLAGCGRGGENEGEG